MHIYTPKSYGEENNLLLMSAITILNLNLDSAAITDDRVFWMIYRANGVDSG